MLQSTEILFAHGELLSAQMLEELAARPNNLISAICVAFGDGIIAGLDFNADAAGNAILTAGVVKWREKIYTSNAAINISNFLRNAPDNFDCRDMSKEWRLELFHNVENFGEINHYRLKLRVRPIEKSADVDYMTLMTFRLFDGNLILPKLKSDAEKPLEEFYKGKRAYLLDTPYLASNGSQAVAPLICRAVAEFLREKPDKDSADWSLLMSLNNFPVISWQTLRDYVKGCGEEADFATRKNFFAEFERCLKEIRYSKTYGGGQTITEKSTRKKNYDGLIIPYKNLE
ncbi:MAG: hypothetical protein IKI08_00865 [Selenomonadaceae bacterium]|nr:hypothetical protein [Selenomonadaceae bacterium]